VEAFPSRNPFQAEGRKISHLKCWSYPAGKWMKMAQDLGTTGAMTSKKLKGDMELKSRRTASYRVNSFVAKSSQFILCIHEISK